ncbi:MAG: glutamate racemase [Clostridiales bacterium]|jgi:glutamate racemase|nr:glutamate racemase [Clostridiales bacterium]
MANRPIGIFDSGVGGFTVLKKLIKILPNERFIYFADSARNPYGNKNTKLLFKFAVEIIEFLILKKVKLIVIACNTICATCFDELKIMFKIPLISVLEAGVYATIRSNGKKIGIIATENTINSKTYENKILKLNSKLIVKSKACPRLVELIENNVYDNEISFEILKSYLKYFNNDIDVLLLGCTHYPYFISQIKNLLLDKIKIIDPSFQTAFFTKKILKNKKILSRFDKINKIQKKIIFYKNCS